MIADATAVVDSQGRQRLEANPLKPATAVIALVVGVAGGATDVLAQPDVAPKPPLTAAPPMSLGPELWRGARIGMTVDDVASRFPGATASKGEVLSDGSRSALIQSVQLGGAPATAQFYFNPNGLDAIIIDRPDVSVGRSADNLVKTHRLIDQLTAAYGKPATCTEQQRVTALSCTWVLGEAKAVASYRDVGGASPALSVSYRRLNDVKGWSPGPVKKLKPR
jgi:hypothetical protein